MVVVRVLCERTYVFVVVAANVYVEERHVSVDILLTNQVFEVLLNGNKRFWQAWFFLPGVESKVDHSQPGVAQAIGYFRAEQAAVRTEVSPKALLGCIADDFMGELRPK